MRRKTPSRKAQFRTRREKDFPTPVNYIKTMKTISQEEMQYQKYILEELDDLEKKFDKIYSDILILKYITSDSLRANKSYQALTELFLKTQQQKKEIEESKISFRNLQDEKNFIFEDYLREFDELVNSYRNKLEQNKTNFRELSEEINKMEMEKEKEIEELKITARRINELSLKKIEIVPTNSLITSDKNDEDLESYCFDFFLKIEESREKLNILQCELEDFCQQQLYLDLIENNDLDSSKIQQKIQLAIKIKDCQYKIMKNLETINSYESKFNRLSELIEFRIGFYQSDLLMSRLNSFCLELEGFFSSYSLDNFRTQLDSLSNKAIEISILPTEIVAQPLPAILEEPESNLTINSQTIQTTTPPSATYDSTEIEPINPIKLFQEVLKNLLDENQQSKNSIIVLEQEISSNYSLFEKLKCCSLKGVDEDEQSTISYFLIKNKLVKLIYNSQDLVDSSEANSRNLNQQNKDQFTRFSSEEILEKLSELEKIKLRFIESLASNHQYSTQNPSSDLSQSFLNNFEIKIAETEKLDEDQSIPKSIRKEVDKLQKLTPNISASIGCFQALKSGSKKEVAL